MVLIKNGKMIINNQLIKKDILIEENKIIKIEDEINFDCEILDAKDCLVMPGAVDVHVHLREPGFEYKETVKTGTMACAKGGVTSIMSMPNLKPCPDNYENLKVQLNSALNN
jgi:dihydroorotase